MAATSDQTPPHAPPLDPVSVLTAAFAQHDFTINRAGQEVHIQTFEPTFDGDTAYIVANAIIDATEGDDDAVTYRYRVELVDRL
jgi:hypothetical protein